MESCFNDIRHQVHFSFCYPGSVCVMRVCVMRVCVMRVCVMRARVVHVVRVWYVCGVCRVCVWALTM